jgi:hypothetical protein
MTPRVEDVWSSATPELLDAIVKLSSTMTQSHRVQTRNPIRRISPPISPCDTHMEYWLGALEGW